MTTITPSRSIASRLRHHPLTTIQDEFEDLMTRFFGTDSQWSASYNFPSTDVSETDNTIDVKIDLPGIDPDDIDIQINRNSLTVSGQRNEEEDEERGRTFYRIERQSGAFSRSVTLPSAVNEDEIAAEYKDGVLWVTLPKAEVAKTRRIQVSR